MLGRLFLLFTLVPVLELWLLITVGGWLGAPLTVGIVLVTGLLGVWLTKKEGARVLRQWQESVARGEIPKDSVTSSLLILVGGILLVTPGVLTDIAGLGLLVPVTRRLVASLVEHSVRKRLEVHTLAPGIGPAGFGIDLSGGMRAPPARGDVIDVDAHEASEPDEEPR